MDDWNKLKRLLQFIKGTINDKRIIGVNGFNDLLTWVDAAYAVHPNMHSHTGGCMSFALGTLHARSTKQKLNTKSSTEAKIVGMSDYLPLTFGYVCSSKSKGIFSQRISYIKIIKVRLRWKETDATLALEILGMLISGISS